MMSAKSEELLFAHASAKPDVILLNPGADMNYGFRVCEHTRAADPSVAIIMLSDHSSEEDEVWGLDAGLMTTSPGPSQRTYCWPVSGLTFVAGGMLQANGR